MLNDYPATAVSGGVQLTLGDAYGDEVRRVVFELHLPSVPALGLAKVGEVVLRHVAVGAEVGGVYHRQLRRVSASWTIAQYWARQRDRMGCASRDR